MSLITNKQQELIDISIEEFIKTYDKVSQQYLATRKHVLRLSSEASKGNQLSPQDQLQLQKLQYELDTQWEIYKSHLQELNQKLEIAKSLTPHYVEELNSQHESLLSSKLSLTKTIKNIKEVQIPLLDKMKKVIHVFEKDLSKTNSTKYITTDYINRARQKPSPKSMNVHGLIKSKSELYDLFNEFDEKVKSLKTVYDVSETAIKGSRPIKSTSYINQELESKERFLALEDDQYLFRVSKIGHQDSYLATASVSEYDKLNDQLTNDICELITHATEAKENWIQNAKKIDGFQHIVEQDSMEVDK